MDHSANEADDCGYVELGFSCAGPSEISFDMDVSATQGHNSVFVGVDVNDEDPDDPRHFMSKWTFRRTAESGPSCDAVGGERGGDVCCPAAPRLPGQLLPRRLARRRPAG